MNKMPLIEAPVPGRICWMCEHVYFWAGDRGYSEMTPGSDFSLSCGKNYWQFENFEDSLDEFRSKLESAERCATFKARV